MALVADSFHMLSDIAALVIAGESVFLMPFVLARVFRPTLLDVFGLFRFPLTTSSIQVFFQNDILQELQTKASELEQASFIQSQRKFSTS